jgi:hypothetical protein
MVIPLVGVLVWLVFGGFNGNIGGGALNTAHPTEYFRKVGGRDSIFGGRQVSDCSLCRAGGFYCFCLALGYGLEMKILGRAHSMGDTI